MCTQSYTIITDPQLHYARNRISSPDGSEDAKIDVGDNYCIGKLKTTVKEFAISGTLAVSFLAKMPAQNKPPVNEEVKLYLENGRRSLKSAQNGVRYDIDPEERSIAR